jgi:ammonium transporter, Amt family
MSIRRLLVVNQEVDVMGKGFLILAGLLMVLLSVSVYAENTVESNATSIDFVWTIIAAALVFLMQAGFAMLETGFTRAKNACNIMMKNLIDFSAGALMYWAVGFAFMFGTGNWFIGQSGFFLTASDPWQYALWFFQVVFAATAATIVSGAVAERMKFSAYLFYTVFLTGLIYPIVGHWIWGGGWLSTLSVPFVDFAGSTVVHSVGGWAGLAGTLILGPRIGRYVNKTVRPIKGHSMTLASLGVFLLWFGWYGFNAGSTTSGTNWSIAVIVTTTTLAASAGVIAAMVVTWLRYGKPDIGLTLGAAIGGLVAITAGTANVSPVSSVFIGAIGGVLYVYSVAFFDKIRVDDPVGAVSAHAVCGAFGTLAVGLFAEEAFGGINGLFFGGGASLLVSQLIGVVAVFGFVFGSMTVFFKVLDLAIGLRVTKEEEMRGLDLVEHNAEAYADFPMTATNN